MSHVHTMYPNDPILVMSYVRMCMHQSHLGTMCKEGPADATYSSFTTVRDRTVQCSTTEGAHVREEMYLRKLPVLFDKEQLLQNTLSMCN